MHFVAGGFRTSSWAVWIWQWMLVHLLSIIIDQAVTDWLRQMMWVQLAVTILKYARHDDVRSLCHSQCWTVYSCLLRFCYNEKRRVMCLQSVLLTRKMTSRQEILIVEALVFGVASRGYKNRPIPFMAGRHRRQPNPDVVTLRQYLSVYWSTSVFVVWRSIYLVAMRLDWTELAMVGRNVSEMTYSVSSVM